MKVLFGKTTYLLEPEFGKYSKEFVREREFCVQI